MLSAVLQWALLAAIWLLYRFGPWDRFGPWLRQQLGSRGKESARYPERVRREILEGRIGGSGMSPEVQAFNERVRQDGGGGKGGISPAVRAFSERQRQIREQAPSVSSRTGKEKLPEAKKDDARNAARPRIGPKSSAAPSTRSGTPAQGENSLSEWRAGFKEMSDRHLETVSYSVFNMIFGDRETQSTATELVNASAQMLLKYALAASEKFPMHVDEFERAYQETMRRHNDILAGRR